MINLELIPLKPALLQGFDNETHVLFRASVEAEPNLSDSRKPLNIAIAIDRSGSMSGQPLAEAKNCAIAMVERMSPIDRVAIITYDSKAQIVVPSSNVIDRSAIQNRIRAITEGGMTALHDGWLLAAEEVAKKQSKDGINRVLLLSDGNANVGLTDVPTIVEQSAKMAEAGITTSTYGLGHHFNEELMVAMAKAGLGQSYYGESAEDLSDSFGEEFDLMLNTLATRLVVTVNAAEGVEIDLLNDLHPRGNGWALPDLAEGGDVWALFRVAMPARTTNAETGILKCALDYVDKDGVSTSTTPVALSLPAINEAAYAAIKCNKTVAARVKELEISDLQEAARSHAERGDWDKVNEVIAQARELAEDNPWLVANLTALERYAHRRERARFSKEAMYSSSRLNARLVERAEVAEFYESSLEESKPAYLRRKSERGKRLKSD